MKRYDVIIVGLGAMGSAAAYHLARRGLRVLGLDRFSPPHNFGSSHGQTRIIREAYFEHPAYVPLIQRAYECWAELEQESSERLWQQTGGLMIGPPEGELVRGAKLSGDTYQLPYDDLTSSEIRECFPAFNATDRFVGVWEPRAGAMFPERCIEAHLKMARRHSAALHFNEAVNQWQKDGDGVTVATSVAKYGASYLAFCSGAWVFHLLADLFLPLACTRQAVFWFQPQSNSDYFHFNRFPIYIWEFEPGRYFYGFPDFGEGVKIAIHHEGEPTDPNKINHEVSDSEVEPLRRVMANYLPDLNGTLKSTAVCMYTNTPDLHFLLDFHPDNPQVFIASPCSGHGFKFSSAIGEIIADLFSNGQSGFDLELFKINRLVR